MLNNGRKGFAFVEAVCATFIAALLLALSATMLIAAARLLLSCEHRILLERAKRELRIERAAFPIGGGGDRFDYFGFDAVLVRRTNDFEEWRLSKQGLGQKTEGTLFAAPR